MKRISFLIIISFIKSLSILHAEQLPNLYSSIEKNNFIIGCASNLAPFQFSEDMNSAQGYEFELLTTILENANIEYEVIIDNWKNIKDKFQNNEIDIIATSIPYNDLSNYNVSNSYGSISRIMIYSEGSNFNCFSDLKDKKIVYVNGPRIKELPILSDISNHVTIVSDLYDGIKIVVTGIADAVICSEDLATNMIERYQLKGIVCKKIEDFEKNDLRFIFSESTKHFIPQFNASFKEITTDGRFSKIREKWFGVEQINAISPFVKSFIYIGGVLGLILFVIIFYLIIKLIKKNKENKSMFDKLSLAIDSNNLIIWIYDSKTKKFKFLHGYSSLFYNNITLDKVTDMISEKYRAQLFNIIDDLQSLSIKKASFSAPMYSKEQKVYAEINMMSIIKDGTIKNVVGSFKDVTKKFERDIELYNAKSKLEEYKYRLEKSISKSDMMIIEYNNITKKIKFLNNQLINENTHVLPSYFKDLIHPEDYDDFLAMFEKMNTGDISIPPIEYRIKYSNESEEYIYKSIQMKPFEMKKGGYIIGYVGVISDITKWKKEINKMGSIEHYEDSFSSTPAFLANISHEIRTPLNAIVGFSDLVNDAENQEERSMFINSIKTNSDLLLSLISDILDLSKIESGLYNYIYSEFKVNDICNDVYHNNYQDCSNNVIMILNTNKSDIVIKSDYDRLKQVLNNLISNAIKYTEEGSITISFDKITQKNREFIKFIICDTGIGIEKERMDMIFDKFTRFNAPNESSGLGLSISKNIIESLGGQIGVESEINKGSIFWFTIPYIDAKVKTKSDISEVNSTIS